MLLLVVPEKIVNLFEIVLFSLIWCRYWANSKLNMAFARPDMCKFFVMSCHCSSKVAKGVLGGGICKMNSYLFLLEFLDTHVSLAPTHVCLSVGWLVGDTFGFPACQPLWSPYVKS